MIARVVLLVIVAAIATVSWFATCALWHYSNLAADIEPLEPRRFERLTVVTVGTGTAYENPSRLGPCVALGFGDRVVLVDAGRAVAEALRAARIPVAQPDTVYLSSLAPENTVGLDDLLWTGWRTGRTRPLRLVGPPGTRALAEALDAAHAATRGRLAAALSLPEQGAALEAAEAPDAWSEIHEGLAVRGGALHDGPLPARAWRFDAAGRAVVVSGIGWDADSLVELARGADVLVHEAFHRASVEMAIQAGVPEPERLRREAALHTATTEVGALATRAGVGTLVLVRLRPPPLYDRQYRSLVGERFRGRVVVASDGDEITP